MTVPSQDDETKQRALVRIGMVLGGKWRLDSLLGCGGMAAVYGATHRNGKRVAVKMLHADVCQDDEVRKRFLQEGYAANAIQHEGAVSVLDDDVAPDGAAFIVMELLEGETLESRWQRNGRKFPVVEVLRMADQLLDVLAAAHAKSIVHRDIKPENVFWTKSGQIKVLDFGIARAYEVEPSPRTTTRIGMIMGTPAFMAPEQARARWDQVDGRTDLWAVGATLFTLLAGRYVHEADSEREQLISSATQRAPSLSLVAAEMPPTVVSLVDRSLAFEREARWPDAQAMQRAVRAALEGLEGAAGGEARAPSSQGPRSAVRPEASVARAARVSGGATAIDTTSMVSSATAWSVEREGRAAEAGRLRSSIAELTERHAVAKKRLDLAQTNVDECRTERVSLEQWFKRQVGTRTAAVEEARRQMHGRMAALARRAVDDRATFGAELDSSREPIARLGLAAESARRDVEVHEAALTAYDARALRRGVLISALLALLFVVLPIVWRATRVVEPVLR